MFYCDAKHFYGAPVMFFVPCFRKRPVIDTNSHLFFFLRRMFPILYVNIHKNILHRTKNEVFH